MPQVSDALIAKILVIAAKKACCDNEGFMVDDYAAGNIDDAYSIGCDDGEILLARELKALYEADEAKYKNQEPWCEFCSPDPPKSE
jgi:hypothetical protein